MRRYVLRRLLFVLSFSFFFSSVTDVILIVIVVIVRVNNKVFVLKKKINKKLKI